MQLKPDRRIFFPDAVIMLGLIGAVTIALQVYGRYNSVSYHVTIYHRNPPIKCGVTGCDFTTREARLHRKTSSAFHCLHSRYIHFHKYYRHGIDLPESIDLGIVN